MEPFCTVQLANRYLHNEDHKSASQSEGQQKKCTNQMRGLQNRRPATLLVARSSDGQLDLVVCVFRYHL